MSFATEMKITFKNHDYFGAKEIGLTEYGNFVLYLYTTPPPEPRGTHFFSIPISPLFYRKTINTTRTAVRDNGSEIRIFDDWGSGYSIITEREVIEQLLHECEKQEINLIP